MSNYSTTLDLPAHRQGDTWDGATISLLDAEDEPISLSGANITMRVSDRGDGEGTTLLDLGTAAGNITIAGNGTQATVAPQVVSIEPGVRHYRIKIIWANGTVRTPIAGQWPILPEI